MGPPRPVESGGEESIAGDDAACTLKTAADDGMKAVFLFGAYKAVDLAWVARREGTEAVIESWYVCQVEPV